EKMAVPSDTPHVDAILGLPAYFSGTLAANLRPSDFQSARDFTDRGKWTPERRIRFSAGWGTLLTNDFRGCNPNDSAGLNPISLTSKVFSVKGPPAENFSAN